MLIIWTETIEETPPIWSSFQQESQFPNSFSKPPVVTHFYYQMEQNIIIYTFFFPHFLLWNFVNICFSLALAKTSWKMIQRNWWLRILHFRSTELITLNHCAFKTYETLQQYETSLEYYSRIPNNSMLSLPLVDLTELRTANRSWKITKNSNTTSKIPRCTSQEDPCSGEDLFLWLCNLYGNRYLNKTKGLYFNDC